MIKVYMGKKATSFYSYNIFLASKILIEFEVYHSILKELVKKNL